MNGRKCDDNVCGVFQGSVRGQTSSVTGEVDRHRVFPLARHARRPQLHRGVALDGLEHDVGHDWQLVFRSGCRVGRKLLSMSCMCVCACVLLCVCAFDRVPRACPVVCCLPCRSWAVPRAVEERLDC